MYLVHPTPAIYAYLRTEFLFNGNKPHDYPDIEKCLLISVKAKTGFDLEFQVLTSRGMLRDKLPISSLLVSSDIKPLRQQQQLQRWCCPSSYLTIVSLPLQTGKVWIEGKQASFEYLFTVDFGVGIEIDPGSDAAIPEEHKAMHIIQVDGQLAAMPNNSLVWDHPTLVPQNLQLRENVGYKVQTQSYSVEKFQCAKPTVTDNDQLYDMIQPS